MSLLTFLLLSLALWVGIALLVAAVWAFVATRVKRDEPVADPPPVYPPLDEWSDFDDVAFAWFCEGSAR